MIDVLKTFEFETGTGRRGSAGAHRRLRPDHTLELPINQWREGCTGPGCRAPWS